MIIFNKKRKARKEYVCDLSGDKISAGETYMSVCQTYEGKIFSIKVCMEAWKLVVFMEDSCGDYIDELLDKETYRYLDEVDRLYANDEAQKL